jgi:predicted dehydrogenase
MSDSNGMRPLRGAVVGYGFIASKGHVPALLARAKAKRDVEIVAVADACEARRVRASDDVPGVRTYADFRALLDAETGSLDFVDICTPPSEHAAIAHAAFDAGAHVVCEKPLATTLDDARAMLEHASRAKRVLFPCHNYKHAPVVKAIRSILDGGSIGRARSLTLQTFRNTHAKGVDEWRPDWRRERRWAGGGIAMDHGSHTFYLTFDWMGSYPASVTAKTATIGGAGHDTEDTISLVLTFPTGIANAHLTWTAGVRKVLYTVQAERGAITVDDDDLELALLDEGPGPHGPGKWRFERRSVASHWMDASHVSWFGSLFEQFRDAIAAGEWVGREAREAFLCIQLITAAYRSAAEGSREIALATTVE